MKYDDPGKLYRDYLGGKMMPEAPEELDNLSKVIEAYATDEEKRENWADFARLSYDGHNIPFVLTLLDMVKESEGEGFEWNFLMAMALYRSAVVINMADDVIYDDNCSDVIGTLRSARRYSSIAQAIHPDPELERLDSVISRALTVARMKGLR